MSDKTLEELLASGTKALKKGGVEWVLERDGQGNITKAGADGPDDHARFMEAMNAVNTMQYAPVSTVKPPDEANRLTLGKARELWLAYIKPTTTPKTYTIKKSAIDNLEKFIGTKTQLHTITRPDLARWYQSLKDADISPPTLVSKQSYAGGKEGFSLGQLLRDTTSPTTQHWGMFVIRQEKSGNEKNLASKHSRLNKCKNYFRPLYFQTFLITPDGPQLLAYTQAHALPKSGN